jgi:hypothetical protein
MPGDRYQDIYIPVSSEQLQVECLDIVPRHSRYAVDGHAVAVLDSKRRGGYLGIRDRATSMRLDRESAARCDG